MRLGAGKFPFGRKILNARYHRHGKTRHARKCFCWWFIGQSKQPRGDSAMEILRERFARGEIEKDEFEAKKKELS